MTDIVKIANHVELALNRIITQYREADKQAQALEAIADQIQELEDAIHGMIDARALATAVGEQLDLIGEIVGADRGNFDDDFYRIFIYVRIGQNTSQGGPQKVIDIFNLLTESDESHYQNLGRASIMLGTPIVIDSDQINFIYRNMELVAAGGVRIDHIVCYDPDEPFAFSGPATGVGGAGFSDITGTTGGKFAVLHRRNIKFAFDGSDVDPGGFGSLEDPIAGGIFVGIKGE